MCLPSYKINNSYTVYVNYFYLNDCIKASKKQPNKKKQLAQVQHATYGTLQPQFVPLPVNTPLQHKKYGKGRVVSTDKSGIMEVAFDSKVLRFIYPEAIRKGHLVVVSN